MQSYSSVAAVPWNDQTKGFGKPVLRIYCIQMHRWTFLFWKGTLFSTNLQHWWTKHYGFVIQKGHGQNGRGCDGRRYPLLRYAWIIALLWYVQKYVLNENYFLSYFQVPNFKQVSLFHTRRNQIEDFCNFI